MMTRIVHIAACLILAATASCSESPPPPPPGNPLVLAPVDASEISLPEPTTADLVYGIRESEFVVVAEVVQLEPVVNPNDAPCTQQGVTYRVVEVLRGAALAETVRVAHPVCLGRPLIDYRAFGLSKAYFKPGQLMVLFLRRDDTGRVRYGGVEWVSDYWVWDERYGTLLDSEQLREYVRNAKASTGGSDASGGKDPFTRRRKR